MQAEYVPVARTREVWNKPHDRILYRFAPLEDILKVYSPIISRHGFSYRWQEETLEGNNTKRVWCIVSGYGHEEKTYVDIPIMPGNDFTNSVQQRGVSTSYGKRYSFANTFGIIFAGDDDESQFEPDTIIGVADEVSKLKAAKSMAELAQVFSAVYNKVKADTSLDEEDRKSRLELLTATKDEMKRSLQ
jgi:prolyl oligopeptidase PreP (S9A serine peptidase family)